MLLSAFTTPVDTANIFVTPFLTCTIATLFHLKVLLSKSAYHREVPAEYVDAVLAFTKNMFSIHVYECEVPILSVQVVAQQLRHVDTIIQRGLQNFLPSR